jgi:hypothetical protein
MSPGTAGVMFWFSVFVLSQLSFYHFLHNKNRNVQQKNAAVT